MISAYFDRLEGNKAVLLVGEELTKVNFPQDYLPPGISPGDYVKITMERDAEATEEAEDEALDLLKGSQGKFTR
ncbi:MAG: DUF3006 domain-containing protein [Selenomonadaceae bacterium]|nr:DUF3006 domain-containing protein [Selenomonadaceae bacterium]